MNKAGLMIKRSLQSHHLRHIVDNRIICSRQASTNVKINNIIRNVLKYNPVSWLNRYFTPGPLPKPTNKEKKLMRGQRYGQLTICSVFFGGAFVLFYYEWKDRQELMEIQEITYDRRMELSVDRYNAATGQTKWDKKKYAQWAEEDRARITFVENVPILVSAQTKEKKKKGKSVKELYEAGDSDNTPTLIGQIKSKL